jgi:DNA-3-methyladenine glycosylase
VDELELSTPRARAAWTRLLGLSTPVAAAELVGWRLVRAGRGTRLVGRIVETEAYLAAGDGASHSARGRTVRNAAMFLAPGHAYVYLSYGVHCCLNVVTGPEGVGEAVLLRALEPLEGLAAMRRRRGARVAERDLCRGPGRLCQALGVTLSDDGCALERGRLWLAPPPRGARRPELLVGPRVGITKSADLPLRFRAAGSRWTT